MSVEKKTNAMEKKAPLDNKQENGGSRGSTATIGTGDVKAKESVRFAAVGEQSAIDTGHVKSGHSVEFFAGARRIESSRPKSDASPNRDEEKSPSLDSGSEEPLQRDNPLVMIKNSGKMKIGNITIHPTNNNTVDITFDGRFGLPEAFEDFTGREDSLAFLEAVDQSTIISHPIKTVSGTGGIGKTRLAVTFAHNKLKQFQETKGGSGYRSIIWFIVGTDVGIANQGLMTEQFQSLGQQLGFNPKKINLNDLIKLIFERLGKEHGPYLVVFDNAQDLRSIKRFLPPSSVPVIITTRNNNKRDWDLTFKSITLNVFSPAEAHAYIKKVLRRSEANLYQEDEANALAKMLGYFPLALTQALTYIINESMQVTVYLERITQQKAKYLQQPVAQGDPYQDDKNPDSDRYAARPREEYDPQKATVWAVVHLSLEKVTHAIAHQILKGCAYLAPEVPIDMNLLGYWTVNIEECQEAVSALRHYSLLENVTLLNHVRIHQLVQEILKLDHSEDAHNTFLTCLAGFMGQHWNKSVNPLSDEARRKTLFPHLQVVLEQIEKHFESDVSFEEMKADLYFYLGNFYGGQTGNTVEAVSCYKQALKIYETSQDKYHERIAKTLMNLGIEISRQGNQSEAQDYLLRALTIKQQVYGPEHVEVAVTLCNLGGVALEKGNALEAKTLLEQSLIIQESIYGPDHHEVAEVLVNLSNALGGLGYALESKTLLERALKIQERNYGPEHVKVAMILGNLGILAREQGDALTAKDLLERALKIQERNYGPEHAVVAKTLMSLGNSLRDLREVPQAKVHLERALILMEQIYGPEHLFVGKALGSLGAAILELDQKSEAKALFERALAIQEGVYGPKHPEVANVLMNLGTVVARMGDGLGAKAFHERALMINENIYGPDHPITAISRLNLGTTLAALGQSTTALEHLQRCHQTFREHFGSENPNTLKAEAVMRFIQEDQDRTILQPSPSIQPAFVPSPLGSALSQTLEAQLLLQPHRLLKLAQEYFDTELVSQSMELLGCIPEQDISFGALYLRAECQLRCGEFIDCRETLSICQALAEDDRSLTKLTTLSQKIDQTQQQTKQLEAELNALKSREELTLKDQLRIVILVRYFRRFEEALSLVNNIIATQPPLNFLAAAYFNRAECYFGLKRYKEALKSCELSGKLKEAPQVTKLKNNLLLAIEISPKLEQLSSIAQQKSGLNFSN